jgi:hypothetical protein
MKQTAVEWLQTQIGYWEKGKDMYEEFFNKAKEMEKKYIIIFADKYDAYVVQGGTLTAEQYYNETFKKK